MQQVAERPETLSYFYDNKSCALGLSNTKIPIPEKKSQQPKLLIHCLCMSDWPSQIRRNVDLKFFWFITLLSLEWDHDWGLHILIRTLCDVIH